MTEATTTRSEDVAPPILVHIGYHKSGSQWLRQRLFGDEASGFRWLGKGQDASHPLHRLVRDRPLEFDAAGLRQAFDPKIEKAWTKNLVSVVGMPRLSGSAYSGGYDSKQIADRIKAVFPEARVLMVIREQRSALVATYKQYIKGGGICRLPEFLFPEMSHGWRVPPFDFRHFEYHHLIRYYRSLFGADRVLCMLYEQFSEDPRRFVQTIAEFCERSLPQQLLEALPYRKRPNPSWSALGLSLARPLNRFGVARDLNPSPLLGGSTRLNTLGRRIMQFDFAGHRATRALAARSETKLRRAVDEAVGDRYVESNRITAELLGVDLAAYGWMV